MRSPALLLMPVVPPLLAAGMPSSDDRACGGVPRRAANYGTACRAPGPISRTLAALLWLGLRLLRGLLGLRGLLRLLLGRRRSGGCLRYRLGHHRRSHGKCHRKRHNLCWMSHPDSFQASSVPVRNASGEAFLYH